MTIIKKRAILFTISFIILGALIYYSGPYQILQILLQVNPIYLLLALLLWALGSVIRTLRWQILLKKINVKIHFSQSWQIYVASMFISNLTPVKTGDPMRSLILKRTNKKSFSKTLPSIILERILDLTVLMIIGFLSLIFLASQIPQISKWFYLSSIAYVLIFIFGFYIISSESRLEKIFSLFLRFFPFIPHIEKYKDKAKYFSKNIYNSFSQYKSFPTLLVSIVLTFIIWFLQAIITLLCFYSIGVSISLWACIAVIPLSVLIGILTFLPGTIGSSELVRVIFFTTLFSLTLSQVTTATILSRLLSFWVYVFLGAFLFSLKFK